MKMDARFWPWMTLLVGALLVAAAIAAVEAFKRPVTVYNFEQCREAGGDLLESYPEQCLYEGKTYMNEQQQPPHEPVSSDSYMGMTENEALLRAEKLQTAARVIERNGESLPVTMDYMPGRLNLFVKDNLVYKIQIEGQEAEN